MSTLMFIWIYVDVDIHVDTDIYVDADIHVDMDIYVDVDIFVYADQVRSIKSIEPQTQTARQFKFG